jgi:hypothetical protein
VSRNVVEFVEGRGYMLTSYWGGVEKGSMFQISVEGSNRYIQIPWAHAADLAHAILADCQPVITAAASVESESQQSPKKESL